MAETPSDISITPGDAGGLDTGHRYDDETDLWQTGMRGCRLQSPQTDRPSHCYHSYMIANLCLVLGVNVTPGNEHSSSDGLPGLLYILDNLAPDLRRYLVRGDKGYGNEAGRGWQAKRSELQLMGWSRKRHGVIMRHPAPKEPALTVPTKEGAPMLPGLSDVVLSQGALWEYSVVMTSLDCEDITLAQFYWDRGDAENTFDELKNQWGWGGFTTQDLKRTQITARMTAIAYNWWSLFVRLVDPMTAREAITSRPLLLAGIARATNHAGQTTLLLTSSHGQTHKIKEKLSDLTQFLRERPSAPQLTSIGRWFRILSYALAKFLHGRDLKPPHNLLPGC